MAEPTESAPFPERGRQEDGFGAGHGQRKSPARDLDERHASGGPATVGNIAPAAGGDPTGLPATANIPWPRLARQDDFVDRSAATAERESPGAFPTWMVWVAAQVCGLALLLGGYFLGQAWSPASRPEKSAVAAGAAGEAARRAQRAGSERAWQTANAALAAERGHDYQVARAIYENAIKQQVPMPSAEYRLALLSLQQGDSSGAEKHLNRSLLAGDEVAECSLLRARFAGMKGNYQDASSQLAAAARARPFNARLCFYWGESLRRAGRAADAVERLSQALDRPDDAAARELYLFKLRLAKVESGDELFAAEVAGHLDDRAAGGDWLLLSAAQEIGRRKFAVSAERLAQAKRALPPAVFSVYTRDYLFQAQAAKSEFSGLLDPAPTPAATPLQDPAVCTAAEADPAVWPPFLKAE